MIAIDDIPAPAPQGDARPKSGARIPSKWLRTHISEIPLADLIDLHEAIKAALPQQKLKDLDLEAELVLQFTRVKELQAETLSSDFAKPNQKAQVANSVASTLAQLTKLQTELHTAERLKAIEALIIRQFKRLPLDVVETFLDDYEAL
jgi:hypothetical protein